MTDVAGLVERLRVIANDQLHAEGFYTQAEEVDKAADALERLQGEKVEIVEFYAITEERLQARIAELEGALEEIAGCILEKRCVECQDAARAALTLTAPSHEET